MICKSKPMIQHVVDSTALTELVIPLLGPLRPQALWYTCITREQSFTTTAGVVQRWATSLPQAGPSWRQKG